MPEDMTPTSGDDGFLPYDPADMDRAKASEDLLRLLNQVGQDIKGWKPEAGDSVYGSVADITEGSGKWGAYPLLLIETPSGKFVGVHAFHTVLRSDINHRIERGMLKRGDLIAISYLGLDNSTTPPYENYRVAVQQS